MPCSKQVIVLTAVHQLVLVSDSAEVVVVSCPPVAPTVGRLLPLDLDFAQIVVERLMEGCHSNQEACRSNQGACRNNQDGVNSSRRGVSSSQRGVRP
jgi:hypothetical protein